MSDSITGITSNALLGLQTAERQVNTAAQNIASAGASPNGPFGSSGPNALTGTQPSSVPGQVHQALSAGGPDLATQLVSLITARTSYAANIDTLAAGERIARQAIDVVT